MERHSWLIWPKRRLYIQDIVSLYQFIITLCGLVNFVMWIYLYVMSFGISFCVFIIMLCHFFHFVIIYFYLHSCTFLAPVWSNDLIHASTKLSLGTTFGKWLVSRALQTL